MTRKPITLNDEIIAQFDRLLEAEPENRQALITRLAGEDMQRRKTLEALLEAHASPQAASLESPLVHLDAVLIDSDDLELPGAEPDLGSRYTIVRLLGCGGHGDVYLAEQHSPVSRRVALKVLRPSALRPSVIDRLHREAKVLAALDHPGIARVFDAGQAADGRPYIITEFVDGVAIDAFCAEHTLGFASRCAMVVLLCAAIEHMHQRGIIHRDLKPANVLVADGTDPQPKLVDFGIARILAPEDGAYAQLTCSGALLGTIGFMSPEQLRGEPADTRADLFAIGRLLEVLLADVTVPARSAKDLAAVLRRATEPDPRDRYASVGELGMDLRAMLDDRPVAVRRQSARGVAARILRRNPVASGLIVLLLLGMLVSGVVIAVQSARARSDRIMQKAMLIDMVEGVIETLSRYVGTLDERQNWLGTIGERLNAMLAVAPHDRELHLLRARVADEHAKIEIARGGFESALAYADQAESELGLWIEPDSAPVDEIRQLANAVVLRGDALHHLHRSDESRVLHERVLSMLRAAAVRFPDDISLLDDLSWSYDRLSNETEQRDGVEAALAFARERLAIAEHMLTLDPDRILSRYNFAMAQYRLAQHTAGPDPNAALELAECARQLEYPLLADDPGREAFTHSYAAACFLKGHLLQRLGRVQEAITAHTEAADTLLDAIAMTGDQEARLRILLIRVVVSLAGILEQRGQLDEAARLRALSASLSVISKVSDYARSPEYQDFADSYEELRALFPTRGMPGS